MLALPSHEPVLHRAPQPRSGTLNRPFLAEVQGSGTLHPNPAPQPKSGVAEHIFCPEKCLFFTRKSQGLRCKVAVLHPKSQPLKQTLHSRRPERARNAGSTEPKRLDDTRCKTYKQLINYRTPLKVLSVVNATRDTPRTFAPGHEP